SCFTNNAKTVQPNELKAGVTVRNEQCERAPCSVVKIQVHPASTGGVVAIRSPRMSAVRSSTPGTAIGYALSMNSNESSSPVLPPFQCGPTRMTVRTRVVQFIGDATYTPRCNMGTRMSTDLVLVRPTQSADYQQTVGEKKAHGRKHDSYIPTKWLRERECEKYNGLKLFIGRTLSELGPMQTHAYEAATCCILRGRCLTLISVDSRCLGLMQGRDALHIEGVLSVWSTPSGAESLRRFRAFGGCFQEADLPDN
ncbi:hypothetical protein T265_12665, partial [Opisthorchis viverrini]